MIDVIVGFRDVVFAALVAWTGAPASDAPKADKGKDPGGKPAKIEKQIEQPAPKIY